MYTGNPKGFGFVTVEGEEEDYFIPESASFSAMHGDKVMIRVVKSPAGRRKEAEVIRIVEHGNSEIVGYFQKNKKYGFDANAIVTMEDVVEHLYNKPYKGRVVIDDTIKAAIDEYYVQYGAEK